MPIQLGLGEIFTNPRLHWDECGKEHPASPRPSARPGESRPRRASTRVLPQEFRRRGAGRAALVPVLGVLLPPLRHAARATGLSRALSLHLGAARGVGARVGPVARRGDAGAVAGRPAGLFWPHRAGRRIGFLDDAHHRRARRGRLGDQRHEAVDHRLAHRRLHHGLRRHRQGDGRRAQGRGELLLRSDLHPRLQGGVGAHRLGPPGRRRGHPQFHRRRFPAAIWWASCIAASAWPCWACVTGGWPTAAVRWGPPAGRWTRPWPTPRCGAPSARPSPTTRPSATTWPRRRPSSTPGG